MFIFKCACRKSSYVERDPLRHQRSEGRGFRTNKTNRRTVQTSPLKSVFFFPPVPLKRKVSPVRTEAPRVHVTLVRGLQRAAGGCCFPLNKNGFHLPDATPLLCSQTCGQNGENDGGKKIPAAHPLARADRPENGRRCFYFLKTAAFVFRLQGKWLTMNDVGGGGVI